MCPGGRALATEARKNGGFSSDPCHICRTSIWAVNAVDCLAKCSKPCRSPPWIGPGVVRPRLSQGPTDRARDVARRVDSKSDWRLFPSWANPGGWAASHWTAVVHTSFGSCLARCGPVLNAAQAVPPSPQPPTAIQHHTSSILPSFFGDEKWHITAARMARCPTPDVNWTVLFLPTSAGTMPPLRYTTRGILNTYLGTYYVSRYVPCVPGSSSHSIMYRQPAGSKIRIRSWGGLARETVSPHPGRRGTSLQSPPGWV